MSAPPTRRSPGRSLPGSSKASVSTLTIVPAEPVERLVAMGFDTVCVTCGRSIVRDVDTDDLMTDPADAHARRGHLVLRTTSTTTALGPAHLVDAHMAEAGRAARRAERARRRSR